MNKGQLVTAFASATGSKNVDAKAQVEKFAEVIRNELTAGNEVTIPGVGKLKVKVRPARTGRNPATGASIAIPEKRVIKFTPSAKFNESFATVAPAATTA